MRLVLWGATGQAVVLAELYDRLGLSIAALFDNDPQAQSPLPGVPLFYGRDALARWARSTDLRNVAGLAAIGGSRGEDRVEIHALFEAHGIAVATATHPTAFIARDATLGKGSQVLAMAAVAARADIGDACIVNTSASVDHGSRLEEGVHVGPGAHLAGEVHVGRFAFIGTGAAVLPRVRVGERSVVGAGSVVVRDVPPGAVVAGNPAVHLAPRRPPSAKEA
ncbi:MAG TPA: NeuD/PglB/VioB family sugar acetyltransferase [Verrucomicrobiae bacterium]|nr:NeuD/PglB/VioB family sugar acetyltransferase [Verrucomicrobiae bacterium]